MRKALADKAIQGARPKKDTHTYGHPDRIAEIKRLIRRDVTTSKDAHALERWVKGYAEAIYHRHYFRQAEKAFYMNSERCEKKIPVMLRPNIMHFPPTNCPRSGEQAEIVQVHIGRKHIGFWVITQRMKGKRIAPYWVNWKHADSYIEYKPHAVEKLKEVTNATTTIRG